MDDPVERTGNVGIAVLAGIAFADAICLASLGERNAGQDHRDAVRLLGDVDTEAAKHLHTLLVLKTETQYESEAVALDKAVRAMRAVEVLAARARLI